MTVFVDGQEYAIGVWSLLGGYVVYPRGIEVNWYYLDLVDSMLRMETKFEVVRKTLEHPGLISSGASLVSLVEGRDG